MIIEELIIDNYLVTKEEFQLPGGKKFTITTYEIEKKIAVQFFDDRLFRYYSYYPIAGKPIELYLEWNQESKLRSFRYDALPGSETKSMTIWPLGEYEDINRNDLLYAQLLARVMRDIADIQRPGIVDALRVLPMPVYNEILEQFRVF